MDTNRVLKGRYVLETDLTPKKTTGVNFTVDNDNVILSFFDESIKLPDSYEVSLGEDNQVLGTIDITGEEVAVRAIHTRIALKKKDAAFLLRSIADRIEGEEND